jgi:uncharacterized DUF497 family protein
MGSEEAKENLSKHGVSFEDGMAVFADPLAKIFKDEDHSHGEHREIIIGHSTIERLLLVSFAAEGARVRIISAREATARERRDYEENA